jgi:integrase/recombinase XerD
MTQHQSTALGRSIARFFQEYLPTLRGMSPHTIRSYRDTMILFLRFAAAETGGSIESLMFTTSMQIDLVAFSPPWR